MRCLSLLLLGLLACVPQPAAVNVPVTVDIPTLQPTAPVEEKPLYAPHWSLTNKNPEIVKADSISPLEAQYILLGAKELKVTVHSVHGRLLIICENGVSSIHECTNGSSFTYMCNGVWLEISCKYKKIVNGIVEEDPLIEPKQNEEE